MMRALRPVEMAKRGHPLSGLANRRRIWQVSQEVLRLYELISPIEVMSMETSSHYEEGAMCRYLPRVADQTSTGFKADTMFFFQKPEDMQLTKRIDFFWSEGALCGVSAKVGTNLVSCGVGSVGDTISDAFDLATEDWLEKIALNVTVNETTFRDRSDIERIRTDHFVSGVACYTLSGQCFELGSTLGCKRLLEPLVGNGVVGIRTELANGRITRFGVLEHAAGMTKHRAVNDNKRLDLLWKSELPSQHLRFDDSTDRIGTHDGVTKTFKIDGPGGERIVGFKLVVGALPVGLILITNHGRQAVFGKSRDNAVNEYAADPGFGVAGIYCSFAYNSAPGHQLSSLSLVQSPDLPTLSMDAQSLMDHQGLMWEPSPLFTSWRATGSVFGSQHHGAVAMVIDFSRPIFKIEGLLPAPEWQSIIELGGWTIHYDDSTLDSPALFGFTSPVWPKAPATAEDLKSMKRYDHMSMGRREQDSRQPVAHVRTDEEALAQPSAWELAAGGEKLRAVDIWAGDFLHGIQFHTQSGKASPRWGKCGGDSVARIQAGGPDQVVGIKIVLGTQRLGFNPCSDAPQAVQAIIST